MILIHFLHFVVFLIKLSWSVYIKGPCPVAPPTQNINMKEINSIMQLKYLAPSFSPADNLLFHTLNPAQGHTGQFMVFGSEICFVYWQMSRECPEITGLIRRNESSPFYHFRYGISTYGDGRRACLEEDSYVRLWFWDHTMYRIVYSCTEDPHGTSHEEAAMIFIIASHGDSASKKLPLNDLMPILRFSNLSSRDFTTMNSGITQQCLYFDGPVQTNNYLWILVGLLVVGLLVMAVAFLKYYSGCS